MKRAKPAAAGTAISKDAQALLEQQDADRAFARAHTTADSFFASLARGVHYELTLASRWGATADVVQDRDGNPIVSRSIREKYPPRRPGRFIKWLFRFRNKYGVPIFNYNPAPRGFIFNEGGRGMTLSILPALGIPFRLYVVGIVLMRKKGKWSLEWNTWNRLRKPTSKA